MTPNTTDLYLADGTAALSLPVFAPGGGHTTVPTALMMKAGMSGEFPSRSEKCCKTRASESEVIRLLMHQIPDLRVVATQREEAWFRLWMRSSVEGVGIWALIEDCKRVDFYVLAADDSSASRLADRLAGAIPRVPPPDLDGGRSPIQFVFISRDAVVTRTEMIDTPDWASVQNNYSAAANDAIARLVEHRPGARHGRLLLLHGPPGTGKTTLLRTLVRAWLPWCSSSVALDPEQLFGDASYLSQLMLDVPTDRGMIPDREGYEQDRDKRWHLVIIEDADELIAGDAKRRTGQAMARLLNLTDGMLGQGLRVLLAITTNEPVGSLHPAMIRAGRALANIEVGPLSPNEARAWLTCSGAAHLVNRVTDETTLAALYALIGDDTIRADDAAAALKTGAYL